MTQATVSYLYMEGGGYHLDTYDPTIRGGAAQYQADQGSKEVLGRKKPMIQSPLTNKLKADKLR